MRSFDRILTTKTAAEDLEQRTLAGLPCDMARLIYLASMRDYNSGRYQHDGLSARFGVEEAQEALRRAHETVFSGLACLPLEELVEDLELYVRTSREAAGRFIGTWQELEPYRVTVPKDVHPTLVQLFLSNIKVGLEVLSLRLEQNQTNPSTSSPHPLLDR